MNSISTAKFLAAQYSFAGRDWFYTFRELATVFTDTDSKRVADRMLQRYAELTKAWNADVNSEWTCRFFMAAKLIMAATLHVNAAAYAKSRNLRVVVPYLRYYAILSLLRSIVLTLPEYSWDNGRLLTVSHKRAITGAVSLLEKFSRIKAEAAEKDIRRLKAERELISYRAPSSGDDQLGARNVFLSLCTLLAEVAQFNSELFEASLAKHCGDVKFELLPTYLETISGVEIDGHYFGDREDAYRLGHLARKYPRPANLLHLMTEGHVEDFFGAWHNGNDEGIFNPDETLQIIFDVP